MDACACVHACVGVCPCVHTRVLQGAMDHTDLEAFQSKF